MTTNDDGSVYTDYYAPNEILYSGTYLPNTPANPGIEFNWKYVNTSKGDNVFYNNSLNFVGSALLAGLCGEAGAALSTATKSGFVSGLAGYIMGKLAIPHGTDYWWTIDVSGDHITLKEQKRKKLNRVIISPDLKKVLRSYTSGKPDDEYLMKSRKGDNQPIKRATAYQILNEAARHFGMQEIGTHTLRKTFGYHFYQDTKDIAMLQEILNHTDPDYTLRYIGVNQDGKDFAMTRFRFKIPRI